MGLDGDVRLLVLGGTGFVGRVVVDVALRRGWHVTMLNRGTRPAPDGAQLVHGDRLAADGLHGLDEAGSWDLVVDTWSGRPRAVRIAAEFLEGRCARYAYVSSRSVYAMPVAAGADETAPLIEPEHEDTTTYGPAKAGSEAAVTKVFGERALLARAGLILGPHEDVGRLPWWLQRIARGGAVLAPGPPELELQFIDVRDLASWVLDATIAGHHGPYNVVSPPAHTTMQRLLDACVAVTDAAAELRWVDPEPILDAGVEPWTELPIWVPPGDLHAALHGADVSAASSDGLHCRPAEDTVTDTWAWLRGLQEPPRRHERAARGLDPSVEARILATASR